MIYWFTGQPGAGKTTLAYELKNRIGGIHIDSDDVRKSCGSFDYSEKGRRYYIPCIQDIAEQLTCYNVDVFVSMVAPYRDIREDLKRRADVVEIYLHTSEIRGREHFFIENYEPPLKDFIDIDTSNPIEACIEIIMAAMGAENETNSTQGQYTGNEHGREPSNPYRKYT